MSAPQTSRRIKGLVTPVSASRRTKQHLNKAHRLVSFTAALHSTNTYTTHLQRLEVHKSTTMTNDGGNYTIKSRTPQYQSLYNTERHTAQQTKHQIRSLARGEIISALPADT